jgi:PAP2 superfamily
MSRRRWSGTAVALLLVAACGGGPDVFAPTAPAGSALDNRAWWSSQHGAVTDAVMAGNAQAVAAAPSLVPPGAPLAPFVEARLYAIANVAMHDALNAIDPEYERYADTGPVDRDANRTIAVLKAARDAIVGAAPGAAVSTGAWYTSAIAPLAGASGFADGVAIGARAAAAILARRAADGTAGGGVAPYTPGAAIGDYQFTFPFNTPGFDFFGTGGFADGSVWGTTVTPFAVRSTSQFRAPRPYLAANNAAAVRTHWYARDFDEVKRLGCDGCSSRTAQQTEIATFWAESSPAGWNRIARTIAEQERLNAHERARLFALLQIGEFDVYATNLESKYHYNFWRPVTAVERAGADGNTRTTPVAGWQVLVFPTPPVPDYPSAHAAAGGAAAAIIESVVDGRIRPFSTTSASLPGAERRFGSLFEAARENADSRVFIGYHFRHATDVGLLQGVAVGAYVVRTSLRRR